MNPGQRITLTKALSAHVGAIAADLRAQMLVEGVVRDRAKRLHRDEQVGEDFDVWTDLLSRRAAVLWVLKTVYVRVLEDRGLVAPSRLLDPETQQLFEKLAPNLGETAFLSWVFRDLASPRGGLPELFAPQPAEVGVPADALSRSLIGFWRAKDVDTGFQWSFAGETFAGELMGDLYQELDPVVKDRYALCQTPDFVRDFMLGQTLTPAIAELGADAVRVLDPACGSGHFLLDALRRLVEATAVQHQDRTRREVVDHVLERVVGIDLNDYACALARARMVMTAAELAGVGSLDEAASFHPNVYWADGLEQVERDDNLGPMQLDLLSPGKALPRLAVLTRPHVRAVLRPILKQRFHVVIGNPPYITERDAARKEYHRETVGHGKQKQRRYVSAYREYSLAAPFIERALQLATLDGRIGLIVGNNFMKREFGKPLIEQVLSTVDLTLVVDASHAPIPFHETPTVLLFGQNRCPSSETVRVVMGKRGESGSPLDPAHGMVWTSILEASRTADFENEFISVTDLPRSTLSQHPWSLGGGGAAELKEQLAMTASKRLSDMVAEIGAVSVIRADDVYEPPVGSIRGGVRGISILPHVLGEDVRDWGVSPSAGVYHPYDGSGDPLDSLNETLRSRLWPFRTVLEQRVAFGKSHLERGLKWFEYSMLFKERFLSPLLLVFANVASHNHVGLIRERMVVNSKAPVIRLPEAATEHDYLGLLGLLNSSLACFWMKQVFFPKGSATHDVSKDGLKPENNTYEFPATGMSKFPLPEGWDKHPDQQVVEHARALDHLARERNLTAPDSVLAQFGVEPWNAEQLRIAFRAAEVRDDNLLQLMVYHQEELDWVCYHLYGLTRQELVTPTPETAVESGSRPFLNAAMSAVPAPLVRQYKLRLEATKASSALSLIETPVYKRLWRGRQGIFGRYDRTYPERAQTALEKYFADVVELEARSRTTMFTLDKICSALQADVKVLAVAEVMSDRRDFSLAQLVDDVLISESLPSHPLHIYTQTGIAKHDAWGAMWLAQRQKEAGETVVLDSPPPYVPGDFLKSAYWRYRGKFDVSRERFIAFTEVPGRGAGETLYGWAGWSAAERIKAILAIDEECEDQGIPVSDRIALLDSAWRLVPDAIRNDTATGARLRAELAALVGPDGPSRVLLDAWKQKFPPTGKARGRGKKLAAKAEIDDAEDDA